MQRLKLYNRNSGFLRNVLFFDWKGQKIVVFANIWLSLKVTRPSFFGGVPSYFEALWYPHL